MQNLRFTLCATATLMSISIFIGCGDAGPDESTAPQSETTSDSDHGHPHHDEGDAGNRHAVEGHSHGAGPHLGTIADWGGGTYHVEFTVDHAKKEATVYVLGTDEKTPTPVKSESILLTIKDPTLQIDLLPVPMEGESDGKSSRFVGTHEALATVAEFEGTISAVVDGTPYSGNFKEERHEHE